MVMMMMMMMMMMMINSFAEWLTDQRALSLFTADIAALNIVVWGSKYRLTQKVTSRTWTGPKLISDSAK